MADLKISQLTGATTPLAGTEVLPIVQSSTTKKIATDDLTVKNIRSNATTGILQVAGPAASTTRTMTTPNANFTAARTDAGQTFTGNQTIEAGSGFGSTEDVLYLKNLSGSTAISRLKFGTAALADSGAIGVYTQDASNGALIIWAKSGGTLTQVAYANSDLTFHVNSNNLVFDTAAKGVNFTANTPAAGMTSQLLNWYEEGTWTPTIIGSSTAGTGTYSEQTGSYTRIGRQVTVTAVVTWSAHTGSGVLRVSGLPFTIKNDGVYAAFALEYANLTVSANAIACIVTRPGQTYLQVDETVAGGTGQSGVTLDTAASLYFSVTYFV